MEIAGIQKLTLVDFPKVVAATVFTRGCTFRCPFCHNPELVIAEKFLPTISEEEIFNFLESRLGKIKGVCITGGEPTIHPDLPNFIAHIKALGYKVKLDTNGSNPEMLKRVIKDGELDYIAMDIKSSLHKYKETTGTSVIARTRRLAVTKQSNDEIATPFRLAMTNKSSRPKKLESNIEESIKLIMNSGIDYEFRTTVCHPLHSPKDFGEIGKMIKGAKNFYIQNFIQSKHVNDKGNFSPFTKEELKKSLSAIEKFVPSAKIRGVS